MVTIGFKWIHIEEAVAREGDSGQDTVVHGTLHHIDELRISGHSVHPPVPEDHADRGAGFAVSLGIRKVVIGGEALEMPCVSDSSCYVHLSADNLVPDTEHCLNVFLVAGAGGDVSHSAEKIHGTDSMTVDGGHLPHRNVILIVYGVEFAVAAVTMAAFVNEPLREIKVLSVTGERIKLDEGKFDFLVPGHPVSLARAEEVHHMGDHLLCDIQELVLSGRFEVSDCGFYEVPGAIHLVHSHVSPTLVETGKGIEGVDVAVRLLSGSKLVDPFVALGLES